MNHTFNKQHSNPVSFDLFLNSTKDSRQKKSSINPHTKIMYKQGIMSGSNCHKQSTTIFNYYNNFPSLTKCHSTAKLTKTQNNSNVSSKSLISFPQERQSSPSPSPQTNLSKICNNEKSFSTTQSTDERKELNHLRTEIKEKNDLIKSLHKAIDTYIQEKNAMNNEITNLKMQLSDVRVENNRIKQDNIILRDAYDKLQSDNIKLEAKKIKLSEIISILNKEEISLIKENKSDINQTNSEDESLSGICFPDKVKTEKKIQTNDRIIPALNFGNLYDEIKEENNSNQGIQLKNICKANEKSIIYHHQQQQKQKQFNKISKITGSLIKTKGSIIKKLNK